MRLPRRVTRASRRRELVANQEDLQSVRHRAESPARPGAEDLCLAPLKRLWAVWAGSCVLLWLLLGYRSSDAALLGGVPVLALSLLATIFLAGRDLRLASAALVAGAGAAIALASALGRSPELLLFFIPAIVAAAGLFAPRASLLWAGAAVMLVLALQPKGADVGLYAVLFAATGLSTWAALQPQYSLLLSTWERAAATGTLMERVQQERGELNKTIKSLDLSYQLLEKTNRELALARREAEMLRDLRTRFATNVSHELRTPLNIILGFSSLIYRNSHLYGFDHWPEALLRDLAQIQRNARHLSQLVDDVIDLARVDALAMPVRRELAQIGPVIREAVESVASMAAAPFPSVCPSPGSPSPD